MNGEFDMPRYMDALIKLAGHTKPRRLKLANRLMKNPPNSKRVMRPSRFGNPFAVSGEPSQEANQMAVDLYRDYLEEERPDLIPVIRQELHGYDLICSCPLDWPCHADVLLEIANK